MLYLRKSPTFKEKQCPFHLKNYLQKYAELIVRVGLNLREGQRLLINNLTTRGVPLHVAPLVREVAKAAYKAGARYVDVLWGDEELLKTRVQMAPRDSFDEFSDWQVKAAMDLFEQDGAAPDHPLEQSRPDGLEKTRKLSVRCKRFISNAMPITSN